jgi:hypothetical protein
MPHYFSDPRPPLSPRPGEPTSALRNRQVSLLAKYRQVWNDAQTPLSAFLFSGCAVPRARIREALAQSGMNPDALARFDHCCSTAWVWKHKETRDVRLRIATCGNRWCPRCRRAYGSRVRRAIYHALATNPRNVSLLTLTQPQIPGEPLADNIRRLRASFDRLRHDPFWTKHAAGGIAVVEITASKTYADAWHAHYHILLQHVYMPQAMLAQLWAKASRVPLASVHITRCNDANRQTEYIAKYLTKPYPNELLTQPERFATYVRTLRRLKLFSFFGTWRTCSLAKSPALKPNLTREERNKLGIRDNPNPDEWEYLGTFSDNLERAQRGDSRAQTILEQLGFGHVPQKLPFDTLPRPPTPPQGAFAWTANATPTTTAS